MFYRETGQFKTSYAADRAIFPIRQDLYGMGILLLLALTVPFFVKEYWLSAILIPFLVFSLAALGLNILTGYAGQLSLGASAFMAVGAYTAWNISTRLPQVPLLVSFIAGGITAAAYGMFIGIPSLRIKGFYLAVTSLAAVFLTEWIFTHIGWFYNYELSATISTPEMVIAGIKFDTPIRRYYLTLIIVCLMALAAKNMMRCTIGREFMAIRDMDVAAEVIGIRMLRTKLVAFGISSFYLGVAGALYAFVYLRSVSAASFDLSESLHILFMIIVGGVGSILGSFLGAAFILLMPIFLNLGAHAVLGNSIDPQNLATLELMVFGGLIIFFLIAEPHGMARLWQIIKEKLRIWPFPH
ncbi:MAG: branched-chain amino acid ABC transporter permease [Proteobacteria bacterium]|nr:branched-chain amino acid ABC transporter permease [Pseudomonadota bacterium]MBU1582847.1 branched-chain amino acid ABC transporter permease [Pseudomonadota bacterium]MBU2453915.1 branched-chain amino acid ABC transporter permease [Pseudomonadota bacterium]MBU2630450.1 branched-chain amino acid ABC transporter permease [Pseudomonadota bacterium]